jgi:cytochrome c-type biogenesis protein CcmE
METSPETPVASSKRRAKFLVGGSVIVFALVGLIGWAMSRPASTSFYMSTSELLAMGPAERAARDVRVNGKVISGSIEKSGLETSFLISDGSADLMITTDRPVPDTLVNDADVVALGKLKGDTFVASEVLAKCPSKFKPKA